MTSFGIGTAATVPTDVDDAFVGTLSTVSLHGHSSIEGNDQSREILGFTSGMDNPRSRVLSCPSRPINIVGAVARFGWMLAGSDRLADIAFYEPKVLRYTDNGLSVPGSNYGFRIFQPLPGVNQLDGAIRRLIEDHGSRRAATVVWSPEDAVRDSKDIPCAFGIFFHIRDEKLVTTTVMRSNNAFILLPYNFFEFSLLGEMVAAEVGVEPGPYQHWAASMHTFDRDELAIREVIEGGRTPSKTMAPMPRDPAPAKQAIEFAKAEVRIRTAISRDATLSELVSSCGDLSPYWADLLRVLTVHKLATLREFDAASELVGSLPEAFMSTAEAYVARAMPTENAEEGQLTFMDLPVEPSALSGLAAAAEMEQRRSIAEAVLGRVARLESETGTVVSASKVGAIVRSYAEGSALAARDGQSAVEQIDALSNEDLEAKIDEH
jgi:thymidylate synthase